jgi:hypothetical protein
VKVWSRGTLVVVVAAALALGADSTAVAKGPSRAVIEGPDIASPIVLPDPNDSMSGPEFGELIMDSGFFDELICRTCDGRLPHRPRSRLGPGYSVTYTMAFTSNRDRRTHSNLVVQYVFPYAEPGPVTHMPGGQRFWVQATVGGWFVAHPKLRRLFIDLVASSQKELRPPRTTARTEGGSSPRSVLPITSVAILAALALAMARVLRPRRRRPG